MTTPAQVRDIETQNFLCFLHQKSGTWVPGREGWYMEPIATSSKPRECYRTQPPSPTTSLILLRQGIL